eukprot:gene9115-23924_t
MASSRLSRFAAVLVFLSAASTALLGVMLVQRHTATAQHYGPRLLAVIPIGFAAMVVNLTSKDIPRNVDPVSGLFIAAFMVYVRRKQLTGADKLIEDDKRNYDNVWNETLSTHTNIHQVIQSLKEVVSDWRAEFEVFKVGSTPPNRPPESKLTDATVNIMLRVSRMATVSSKHTGRPRQQVADICVLFAQAGALNDHFQGLVLQWAEGLGSAVVVHSSPVKRRARAIEKLHRSYHGDPGWIIDLVRASITFQSLDALLWCVQRLVADNTVGILQIKNRFDTDYDSVEHHVCELQLGLAAIDAFKNDSGHDKYVTWRNMRAE